MTDAEYTSRVAEIDRILNDPEVAMDADKVWSLLADIADQSTAWQRRRTGAGPGDAAHVLDRRSGGKRGSRP